MKRLFLVAAIAGFSLTSSGCGGQCNAFQFGGAFCVPDGGPAAAGAALRFELISDGCGGSCGSSTVSNDCVVTRDGGAIILTVENLTCHAAVQLPRTCPAICQLVKLTCTIPALAEGDYTILSGSRSQPLTVRDGGATGCTASAF